MTTSSSTGNRFPAASLGIAMAIIGTVGAFATESKLDPVTIVFWRCVFGTLFLGAWCALRGYLRWHALSIAKLGLAALGGICMVLSWTAFFAGFSMTSIATTTIVYHIQPFFVVLIGAVILKERITLDQIMWMAAAFLGVVLASGLVLSPGPLTSTWAQGIVMSLGAALLYAIATILAKGLGDQRPELTALCQTITGCMMLAPFADFAQAVPAASWHWLIGIGVLHTGIAYVLIYSAYPRLSTPMIGVLTFIYPLVAILVDWAIYDHPLGWAQAIGMVLIATGTLAVRLGWRLPSRTAPASRARWQ
nr:DMT family transporter [uncultured Dongia sp.]